MRTTKQKTLLAEEVKKFKTFFTAEELLAKVNKKDPKIGIATVYRYLKAASEKHEVHSYTCDRRSIYTTQKKNHCHFTCTACGKIEHFDIDNVNFLKNKLKGKLCHFQIDVHGVCEDCDR